MIQNGVHGHCALYKEILGLRASLRVLEPRFYAIMLIYVASGFFFLNIYTKMKISFLFLSNFRRATNLKKVFCHHGHNTKDTQPLFNITVEKLILLKKIFHLESLTAPLKRDSLKLSCKFFLGLLVKETNPGLRFTLEKSRTFKEKKTHTKC